MSGTGGPGPNPFDAMIDVADLVTYNGLDNLLVDISLRSGSSGRQFDAVIGTGVPMRRLYGADLNSSTRGHRFGSYGLVTAFEFEPVQTAPVPEPASLFFLSTGTAGLIVRRWKRRRSA